MKLFCAIIFMYFTKGRCESFCATSSSPLPVATMCSASTVIGNYVVIDVTGAQERMIQGINSCTCYITPVVYKENARLHLFKQSSLEPGYNGCGTRIDVVMDNTQDSEVLRNICFLNGDIGLKNNSMGNITFVKEFPPYDDRYCVALRSDDSLAKLFVQCFIPGEEAPFPTQPASFNDSTQPFPSSSSTLTTTTFMPTSSIVEPTSPTESTNVATSTSTLTTPFVGTTSPSKNVQTTTEIVNDVSKCKTANSEYAVLKMAFSITVTIMVIVCIGGVFLSYKLGFRNGKKEDSRTKYIDKESTQRDYHQYLHIEDSTIARQGTGNATVTLGGRTSTDSTTLRSTAYEEIEYPHRHRMHKSERDKDDEVVCSNSKDLSLTMVDRNGYLSPISRGKQSTQSVSQTRKHSQLSVESDGRLTSSSQRRCAPHISNSDSNSNQSASRKYKNASRNESLPKVQSLHKSIEDTHEHPYIDLHE